MRDYDRLHQLEYAATLWRLGRAATAADQWALRQSTSPRAAACSPMAGNWKARAHAYSAHWPPRSTCAGCRRRLSSSAWPFTTERSTRCTHFVKATAAPRKPFCGSSRGRPGHEIDHTRIDKAPWNAGAAATHGDNFEPMQGRVRRRREPVACRRVRSVAKRSGRASCSRSCVWCSRSSGGRPRSPLAASFGVKTKSASSARYASGCARDCTPAKCPVKGRQSPAKASKPPWTPPVHALRPFRMRNARCARSRSG
jgi:hypothetical protein